MVSNSRKPSAVKNTTLELKIESNSFPITVNAKHQSKSNPECQIPHDNKQTHIIPDNANIQKGSNTLRFKQLQKWDSCIHQQ